MTGTDLTNWLIVVPARLASARLPEKAILDLGGKPMVVRVYENLAPLRLAGAEVVVAVDEDLVAAACRQHGVPFSMTSRDHATGTDRCAEVARRHPGQSRPFILNVQGDEPFIDPQDLIRLCHAFAAQQGRERALGGGYLYACVMTKRLNGGPGKNSLAMHSMSAKRKRHIAELCLSQGIKLQLIPKLEDMLNQGVSAVNLRTLDVHELLGREVIQLDQKNVNAALFGKTILITGAAGSIGSEIGRQVLGFWPAKVVYLDQAETPLFHLERDLSSLTAFKGIAKEYLVADICQISVMRSLFQTYQIDVVYHAAAYKHVPLMEGNPLQALVVNTWGSAQLAELAIEFGVEKFVQVSTDKAVNPTNVMGASKRAAERYIQSLSVLGKTQFITTRFGNVLGSNGSVIPLFEEQIKRGGPITVTHPEITRYFMTIPEACSLVLEAGALGKGGEIYVFDMGSPVKIRDLAENMIRLAGLKPYLDINIVYSGLRPGEKLYEELLGDAETTIPTTHPKIMIAKVTESNVSYFQEEWRNLWNLIQSGESSASLVSWLKSMVPEYKSENSPFEIMDQVKTSGNNSFSIVAEPLVLTAYANSHTKRWFDIGFSILVLPFALLFVAPVFCVYPFFAGGGFVFKHYRVGKDGRRFYLYKIRSLKKNHNNPRAGMVKGDGTVIPVLGHFLRATRIDELPQIWNILRGDMSWVGPRPEQLEFVKDCIEKYPAYDARHAVRPGITGLAQVHNPNATIDDHQEKLVHDLAYMRTAGLRMDIRILWRSLGIITKR